MAMISLSFAVSPSLLPLTQWLPVTHIQRVTLSVSSGTETPHASKERRGVGILCAGFAVSALQILRRRSTGSRHDSTGARARRNARGGATRRAGKSGKRPRCVVFDLDGCLWSPEMYQLEWDRGGAPFTAEPADTDGALRDRRGTRVQLHSGVRSAMTELVEDPKWDGVVVAVASCCDVPSWARELLSKFDLGGGRRLSDIVTVCEIHGGNKKGHFRQIASATGCDLGDMIFFDNEPYNCQDVASLGVTSVYCPEGVTETAWRRGLSAFPCPRQIVRV